MKYTDCSARYAAEPSRPSTTTANAIAPAWRTRGPRRRRCARALDAPGATRRVRRAGVGAADSAVGDGATGDGAGAVSNEEEEEAGDAVGDGACGGSDTAGMPTTVAAPSCAGAPGAA